MATCASDDLMQLIKQDVVVSFTNNINLWTLFQASFFFLTASKMSGNVGALHFIQNESDFEFLTKNPPAPPYAAIVKPKDFTRENILRLRDSQLVSAIILINDTEGLTSFSQELKCPNEFHTHLQQPQCDATKPETTWNPFGSGLLQENFEIPIIFLSDQNETAKVVKCFNDFNADLKTQAQRSLCSIEVNALMTGAGNSEICMRRSKGVQLLNQVRYCDPLQGKNIFGTLYPRQIISSENRTIDVTEKFILISARFDTATGFDGLGLGAMDSLTSAATLVTAAHFLRKITSGIKDVNVIFILFNGESFDFIGSQRFIYDLKKSNTFPSPMTRTRPINLDNVLFAVDIGVLDNFDEISLITVKDSEFASNFSAAVQSYNKLFNFNLHINLKTSDNIPPVSAQTFLRENVTFPVLVVTTEKPENRFYHSVFDDAANLNYTYRNTSGNFDALEKANFGSYEAASIQARIRNVATLISLAVFDSITGKSYDGKEIASAELTDEFLYCYLVASKCRLIQATYDFKGDFKGFNFPPLRYISVQQSTILESTAWMYSIFAFALGREDNSAKENCTILPKMWIPGVNSTGECRVTTQNFSLALSPAFEDEENYDFTSNRYSTWTESTWNSLSARIFLRPSATHESLTFSIGFVVMILSFVAVFLIKSKSDVLFGDIAAEQ